MSEPTLMFDLLLYSINWKKYRNAFELLLRAKYGFVATSSARITLVGSSMQEYDEPLKNPHLILRTFSWYIFV